MRVHPAISFTLCWVVILVVCIILGSAINNYDHKPSHDCPKSGKVINRWVTNESSPIHPPYILQVAYGNCVTVEYVDQQTYNNAVIGGDFHE